MPDVDTAKRWRALAAEMRVKANEMTDHEAKRVMLDIAASYDFLAERAEARGKPKKSD